MLADKRIELCSQQKASSHSKDAICLAFSKKHINIREFIYSQSYSLYIKIFISAI
ncbi:hypothetical protein Aasi_1518 [Candidatus Amoebophilus asiaticus 5a2]|uniref:Uncharacterized protein n=1 Tax=Amoebophilus asiaticus (strain 5a2) TaxID=452471 RepID=C3L4F9_AMOA5|nr:hypothetical protein Aasi_1518 [Candidatus Amoebophilus asiaticus 5a2]